MSIGLKPKPGLLSGIAMTPIEGVVLPADGELPITTHQGVFHVGDVEIRCYQLSDGQRVLDGDDVKKFFADLNLKGSV